MRRPSWGVFALMSGVCVLVTVPTARANGGDIADIAAPGAVAAQAVRVRPPPRTFTIAATGDVLTENAVNLAATNAAGPGVRFDYTPVFASVAPVLRSADLAICHMEIPIGAPGERPGVYGRSPFGGNLIEAPFEVAAGLRAAGFDRCSTASNHSYDLGAGGISSTLAALDAAGITHTGTARSPAESSPAVFEVNGVRVTHLSYTTYSNTVAPSVPWLMNYTTDPARVAADVDAARSAGAQVVIVSVHIAQELLPAPIAADRAFISEITKASHIDLVIEHGPHVVQPVERVNGTVVFWSVGNFVSGMGTNQIGRYADPHTLDGLLASVRFTETSPGTFAADATPVLLCEERADRTVHPVIATLADPTISPTLRAELQECLDRSTPVVAGLR